MTTPQDLTSLNAIERSRQILRSHRMTDMHPRTDVPYPDAELAWRKTYPDLGDVYFACVGWQHANARVQWGETELSMLDVVVHLQREIWGIPTKNCTSPLDMSIVGDTGGSILFAYLPENGLSPEGWLGFALGYGSRDGVNASRFLAVRDGYRGFGIGSDLKFLQAYIALKAGHHAMEWTFDPMRSANAYLNLNVLGADIHRYVESKYGDMGAALYGRVPSHRFFVRWHLTAQRTLDFWQKKESVALADLATIPVITHQTLQNVLAARPKYLRFDIPRDIDTIARQDPPSALRLRAVFHDLCVQTLDSKIPRGADGVLDPAMVYVETRTGRYQIMGFQIFDDQPDTASYIFMRKDVR